MFIRCTRTRSRLSGEPYVTYRLVQTARVGAAVKQTTLLNLGSHFDLPQDQWAGLALRIDELLRGQTDMLDPSLSEAGLVLAQRYAAQLIALRPSAATVSAAVPAERLEGAERAERAEATELVDSAAGDPGRFQEVDLDSIELVRPRSVGVEQVALSVMRQCGFEDQLAALGFNRPQIAAVLGSIIARMAHPGSEPATHDWLRQRSALGELIDFDFEAMDLNRLHRASDALHSHRQALQAHLFAQAQSIIGLAPSITLYDLSTPCFEGLAAGVGEAGHGHGHGHETEHGHRKDCRSDCPLATLAMVLDGSGFVRRTQVFAGKAGEPATLQEMLTGLGAAPGATVVIDAGIASEAQLRWLRAQGLHYIVSSRLAERPVDPARATEARSAGQAARKIHRALDAQGDALLYGHSPAHAQNEATSDASSDASSDTSIDSAQAAGFEAVLAKLQSGLSTPRGSRELAKVIARIDRAKQRWAGAAPHYEIELSKDDTGQQVRAISWTQRAKPASAALHPGAWCLRTSLVELDDATLWRRYTMLTDLQAVFRSFSPVFHQVDRRLEGQLFISVLAYHFVHLLRLQLKAQGIDDSWSTLRETLAVQQRVTTTLQRRDGRTVHVRKSTRPEPRQHQINTILGSSAHPGGSHRVLV